jgi:hypothetical protein
MSFRHYGKQVKFRKCHHCDEVYEDSHAPVRSH